MLHIPLLPLLDRCQDICPSNISSRHMYEMARAYALARHPLDSCQDIGPMSWSNELVPAEGLEALLAKSVEQTRFELASVACCQLLAVFKLYLAELCH